MEVKKTNNYLGTEKLSKLLLKFAIPCVTSLLIGAIYNMVDQIFIGNSELGYLGNAATGVSFPVICIANACAWCIGDGAAAYLSLCGGRNDTETAHKAVGTGILGSFIVSVILSVVCLIFCKPLMELFGASVNSIDLAVDYFQIIALFFPCYLLFNVLNSMIRSDGSPAYAMISMVVGAVLNVILDPLFIYVFKWGIKGAAWATVIGQTVSVILSGIYFIKPKTFKLSKESFKPDLKVFLAIIKLGFSVFLTQISIVIVNIICNVTLKKFGGLSIYGEDIPMSVFSIQTKVVTIVINIVVGIVLGAQPIFGYNYGAGNKDRVKKLFSMVMMYSVGVGVLATLLAQIFPRQIIGLFGGGSELYFEFAEKTFRIYLMLIIGMCVVKVAAIFFQSIGKAGRAAIASLIRDILIFAPNAIVLPIILEKTNPGTGIMGLLYAGPIADAVALIVAIILFITFFKKYNNKEKVVENN